MFIKCFDHIHPYLSGGTLHHAIYSDVRIRILNHKATLNWSRLVFHPTTEFSRILPLDNPGIFMLLHILGKGFHIWQVHFLWLSSVELLCLMNNVLGNISTTLLHIIEKSKREKCKE